jgi:hypothetical protein
MKKIILYFIPLLFATSFGQDSTSTKQALADTFWQKVAVRDSAISMQTKYIPVIMPHIEKVKPKNKIPNYILGGSAIALGILGGTLAIIDANDNKGYYGSFGGAGQMGAYNTRLDVIFFSLSLGLIILGTMEYLR